MNDIILTIVLLTIFGVFSLYYYHKPGNKNKKVFRQSLTQSVFFSTFVAPIVAASLFSFLISLTFREGYKKTIFKSDVVILTSMFYLYGVFSVAHGIHALAKVFRSQVVSIKDKKLLELTRFFHGPFSHWVMNISFILLISLLFIYNLNHPSWDILSSLEITVILICAVAAGICVTIAFITSSTIDKMHWYLGIVFLILFYFGKRANVVFSRSPLSIYVLAIIATSFLILIIDRFGPKKHWFFRKIDRTLLSVNTDWNNIFRNLNFEIKTPKPH